MKDIKHQCPVCGFAALKRAAYNGLPTDRYASGSCEICPSCGFQFGITDDDQGISFAVWRQQWIDSGKRWQGSMKPAIGWNADAQLAALDMRVERNLWPSELPLP